MEVSPKVEQLEVLEEVAMTPLELLEAARFLHINWPALITVTYWAPPP